MEQIKACQTHPEVGRNLTTAFGKRATRFGAPHNMLPAVWAKGGVEQIHLEATLLNYIGKSLNNSLLTELAGAIQHPELHDDSAQKSLALIREPLNQLLLRSSHHGDGETYRPYEESSSEIATGLLSSSTFRSSNMSYGFARGELTTGLNIALRSLLPHKRYTRSPNTTLNSTVEEILVGDITAAHQRMLTDMLTIYSSRSYGMPSHMQMLSPVALKGFTTACETWRNSEFDKIRDGENQHYAYYLEHGGMFTVANMERFGALVGEYNLEWAMAAMEWE